MPPARPHPPVLWPAAVFAATLAALLVATVAAVDGVPRLREAAAGLLAAEQPGDRDHYLAGDIGGQVDHHVLFFGLDPDAHARLRTADVLFVGNSRLMFALRPVVLRPAFGALGQSYYALGFGFREADRFPLAIIRRFDLRPRVVVVNADGFFGGGLSAWAEVVNRDTAFAARKLRWEAETAHDVRRAVHIVAPNWLALFGRPGLVLTGETPVKQRKELVRRFQEDEAVPFFVLSLKAGGAGLNLTAASHVIHFDRWWNPAVENQATDRAFRIGQSRNVLVHKFVCRGTVEEKIDALIASKRQLSADLLDGGEEVNLTALDDRAILDLVRLDLNAVQSEG